MTSSSLDAPQRSKVTDHVTSSFDLPDKPFHVKGTFRRKSLFLSAQAREERSVSKMAAKGNLEHDTPLKMTLIFKPEEVFYISVSGRRQIIHY